MEENTVEVFDYLRVVWKRKILAIVVILVSIVAGVVMSLTSKLPVIYRAEVVIKIGKKVSVGSNVLSAIDYIIEPAMLAQMIPIKYDFKLNEGPGYHLDVEQIGTLAVIRLIVKGPDKEAGRVLNEIADMLIDDHSRQVKDSVGACNVIMKKLEADAKMIQEDIAAGKVSIKEMKGKQDEYLVKLESSVASTEKEADGGDRSAFLNMLYLRVLFRTTDKEGEINSLRETLRQVQTQLIMHKMTLDSLGEHKSVRLSDVKSTAVKQKKKSTQYIIIAGVAGLMMSLFIAFFLEYIEESKSRRKGKWQG